MTWNPPKTWTAEPLTSLDLNEQVRDNLEALKDPPSANYEPQETTDYLTSSQNFVDVDSENLAFNLETNGGDVLIGFHGTFYRSTFANAFLDVEIDGVRIGGTDGILRFYVDSSGLYEAVSFTRLVTGLDAAPHIFKLQWKVLGLDVTLFAGAGTNKADVIPQFWVREVS